MITKAGHDLLKDYAMKNLSANGKIHLGTLEFNCIDENGTVEIVVRRPAPLGVPGESVPTPEPSIWELKPGDVVTVQLNSPFVNIELKGDINEPSSNP